MVTWNTVARKACRLLLPYRSINTKEGCLCLMRQRATPCLWDLGEEQPKSRSVLPSYLIPCPYPLVTLPSSSPSTHLEPGAQYTRETQSLPGARTLFLSFPIDDAQTRRDLSCSSPLDQISNGQRGTSKNITQHHRQSNDTLRSQLRRIDGSSSISLQRSISPTSHR